MGFRFQRRIKLFPGVRLNLSKSGVSTSVGRRGLWFTFGPRGQKRETIGLPGTGLRWTEQHGPHAQPRQTAPTVDVPSIPTRGAKVRTAVALVITAILSVLVIHFFG